MCQPNKSGWCFASSSCIWGRAASSKIKWNGEGTEVIAVTEVNPTSVPWDCGVCDFTNTHVLLGQTWSSGLVSFSKPRVFYTCFLNYFDIRAPLCSDCVSLCVYVSVHTHARACAHLLTRFLRKKKPHLPDLSSETMGRLECCRSGVRLSCSTHWLPNSVCWKHPATIR